MVNQFWGMLGKWCISFWVWLGISGEPVGVWLGNGDSVWGMVGKRCMSLGMVGKG